MSRPLGRVMSWVKTWSIWGQIVAILVAILASNALGQWFPQSVTFAQATQLFSNIEGGLYTWAGLGLLVVSILRWLCDAVIAIFLVIIISESIQKVDS